MILFPNCKINLGLDVLAKRPDGFHDIETVMLPVTGLCDGLEMIRSAADGISLSLSGTEVDCPVQNNLIFKAYEALKRKYGIGGVRAHLHKAIPFGAGLGGGSADAAFAIKGLNELFELGLVTGEMEQIAAEIGSDTPFFIENTTKLCEGRGEVLSSVSIDLKGKYLLMVVPKIHVSTAEAYGGITPRRPGIPLRERIKLPLREWKGNIGNAFEITIFEKYPALAEMKRSLYDTGASYASMSGSGPSLFGIFDKETGFYNRWNVDCDVFGFCID